MRVIVVDDSNTMRRIIKRALEASGCHDLEAIEASDGDEALSLLVGFDGAVDLILCDMNMPRVGGLSLLQSIRNSSKYRHIPFVIVTADETDETTHRAMREGAAGLVVKPFDPAVISQLVKRMQCRGGKSVSGAFRTEGISRMTRSLMRGGKK